MRRVITAIIFGVSTSTLFVVSELTTMICVAALSGLCAWEFYALLRSDAKLPNELIGTVAAVLYPVVFFFWHFNGILSLTTIFAVVLLVWYVNYAPARITDVAITVFGALYTGLMLTSIELVRGVEPSIWGGLFTWGIVLSVYASDACAFWVGSAIGKHKLAPRISPNKSWEGFIAGILASVLVWCLLPLIPGIELSWVWAVVGGIACGWVGVLGDLVESRIKRSVGKKDSSNLLPGHGGFLDRCDSLITVGVVAYLVLRIAGVGTGAG